jgi:hypothetical protein
MAIPSFDSMLAIRLKDVKQKRKWHSQNNTDVQPPDDSAALPTMARYTGLDHETLRKVTNGASKSIPAVPACGTCHSSSCPT